MLFRAQAATFPKRSVQLGSIVAGDTSSYKFAFIVTTPGAQVGSIRFQFCDDTPLVGQPCNPPTGFDASGAVLVDQQNNAGFTIGAGTNANTIVIGRTPAIASIGMSTYDFSDIVNPASSGTYFVRVETFGSNNATGPHVDYGGLAFAMTEQVTISAEVPPFLLFCNGVTITGFDCTTATGDYINFGEFSTSSPRTGTTQMLLATNADGGYSVTVQGTTMLSGVNSIPALNVNDVSRPGTSQFGINLRNNSDPNVGSDVAGPGVASPRPNYAIQNRYRFVSGEQIAFSTTSDDYRKYTVTYLVNIANGQPAGIYVSTLTYTALATF